jgi:purine-binding chemotaxis protein CheW
MGAERVLLDLAAEARFRQFDDARQATAARALREMLAFRLAGEEYAVDIGSIEEIIKPRPPTEVPSVPAFCPGIVSLRGRIVTMIDLRKRLGLPADAPGRSARVIVARSGARVVGLLVDAVSGVIRLAPEDLEATPVVVGGVDGEFLGGLGRVDGRVVILLNLSRVLEFTID